MSQRRQRFASVLAVAFALGLHACGDGVVLPNDGEPADLEVVSGNTQRGPAGAQLGQALVVRVSDGRDRPMANETVEFSIESGDGSVTPQSATTNADGRASATWRLGPAAGEQRVRARVREGLVVSFTATAISGSAGTLELFDGDGQVGGVNSALAEPLVVRVLDELGNGVPDVTVSWTVEGGGSIDPTAGVTGPDGTASAVRVLGPNAGPQSAQAAVPGLANSPVTFSHTADASTPAELVRVSGNGQTAPAGFQLPDSLVVQLLDANGNGVGGRSVTWVVPAPAGAVNPVNSITTPEGYAVTRWTLGAAAGSYAISAVFSGLPPVGFTATATSDAPTTLALLDGNGQTGPVGTTLPQPLRVRVTDANGNGVENVSVTWTAVGGSQVSSTTTGTNGSGVAEVELTLGAVPGTYTTTATVDGLAGSPVSFTSIAEVGSASRLAIISQPVNALVGQTLPTITVEVQDAQGNRVANATNRVTLTPSVSGSLDGDNQVDAVNGVATFDGLSIDRAGAGFRLTARASALTDAVSNPFDIGPGATTIAITGRNPSSSFAGQAVTVNFAISITPPAAGTLSGAVQVSDGTQSCNGSYNFTTGVGSCVIAFATAGDHQLTATFAGGPNFTGSTSAPVTHPVTRAGTTVVIGNLAASVVGQPLTVPFTVTAQGGGTPPGSVTITISGGPETCTATIAVGSCAITPLSGGSRSITATYPGDANFDSDIDIESIVIRSPTSTTVTTSDASTVFGENVTFTATVAPVPPSTGLPGGSVQFEADGVNIGGPVTLSAGSASRSIATLSVGTHVITADYVPVGLSFASSSGTLAGGQTVTQASTTTGITGISPEPSDPGEGYTVTVSVQPVAPGGGTPEGSVSIVDGEGGSCVATLSGGSGSCALASATPGGKTITATYGGSVNHGGSAGTAAHSVNAPPTASADAFNVVLLIFQAAPGVLANDSDPDGNSLTAVLNDDVDNGLLTLNSDGSFLYTPTLGFVGTDSFTYQAFDGSLLSAPVTVTLQVSP